MTDEEYEALEDTCFGGVCFRGSATAFLRVWADCMEDTLLQSPRPSDDKVAIHIGFVRALVDERERRRKSAEQALLVKEP